MKIISMTTDSSEYAVVRSRSSLSCCLKKVRMQTVMGGKQAPVVAARTNATQSGVDEVSATTSAASAAGNANAHASSVTRGP